MTEKIRALESGIFALLDQWQREPDIDRFLSDLGVLIEMRAALIRASATSEGEKHE